MIDRRAELKPGNWQMTAATLMCDYIKDDVTMMVNRDWSTTCHWYHRYKEKFAKNRNQKPGKAIRQKLEKCVGPECPVATTYRNKLIKEELGADR